MIIHLLDREYPIPESFHGLFEYNSYAHCCPCCLKVWARIQVANGDLCFPLETTPCENCVWPWPHRAGIPGSLLNTGLHHRVASDLLLYLPRELLLREFRVHLKALGIPLYALNTDENALGNLRRRVSKYFGYAFDAFDP